MNINRLLTDIHNLYETWDKQAKSADIIGDKREWIRGVCYGILLTVKVVHFYVDADGKDLEGWTKRRLERY